MKARVGMEKNDVKRVVGASIWKSRRMTHANRAGRRQKQLKKSMGADCAPHPLFFAISLYAPLIGMTARADDGLPCQRCGGQRRQSSGWRSNHQQSSNKLTPPQHTTGARSKFQGDRFLGEQLLLRMQSSHRLRHSWPPTGRSRHHAQSRPCSCYPARAIGASKSHSVAAVSRWTVTNVIIAWYVVDGRSEE